MAAMNAKPMPVPGGNQRLYTKVIADAGLIVGEKRGRWTWWRVAPQRLAEVFRALGG